MAKILIVDDVHAVRAMLRAWLESDGHAVADVSDCSSAMSEFESCEPDLVIVDVSSSAVDGLSFVQALRTRPTKARIIATSAQPATAGRDDLAIARVLGAVATMKKPFVLKQFKQVVRGVLSSKSDEHEFGC